MKKLSPDFLRHAAVFTAALLLDQLTKVWARGRFSLPGGEPDYSDSIRVIGEWLQFRLVYNHGAAFGMKPHSLLPFLHPMFFYVAFSLVAIVLLSVYYRKLGREEGGARLGIALILSGAVGNNLIDRLFMHKVTDFIDAGIPGYAPRWPVFNIADSAVSIGLVLLIFAPMFARKTTDAPTAPSEDASDAR
jgi:signal peptidase II